MNTKPILLAAASALLLSACASSGMRAGMGYSPAAQGRGDYYTGAPDYRGATDWPWDFRVGLVSWGGYCPVRYRYCTTLWADPFYSGAWYGYFYSPFYDPFWNQPWLYFHRSPQPRYDAVPTLPIAGRAPVRTPPPAERPRPQAWEERPAPRTGGGFGTPRPRARAPRPIGGSN